ncbi:hypothetical protein AAFF_G00013000 [Aldrovandia affinis]|uniref:Uncharacterized protein n=1 Tax=Aldrovandia affinis TaxID=143900 RepID=A0AAD7S6L2_9TELE|nr:hypothetical protein AAFF_G00013000 [Aldrovandia affinis]
MSHDEAAGAKSVRPPSPAAPTAEGDQRPPLGSGVRSLPSRPQPAPRTAPHIHACCRSHPLRWKPIRLKKLGEHRTVGGLQSCEEQGKERQELPEKRTENVTVRKTVEKYPSLCTFSVGWCRTWCANINSALRAFPMKHPLLRARTLSDGTKKRKGKALRLAELLWPVNDRLHADPNVDKEPVLHPQHC